jgi:type IV pilus assembly protein PilC
VEKNVKLKSAVKSALIYPVSVISIAALVVGALLKFVVPIFANMFASMSVDLPLPTKIVIGLSNFVKDWWWVFLFLMVALFFGIKLIRRDPKGRYALDKFMLSLPVLGPVLRKIAVARFTRTLGTLITSGVPILEGLAITARTSGNAVLEVALMKVRKAVEEGRTIVDPLKESGVFPNMVTQMIGVGEATGAMDAMLQKIADFYEDEVDAATKNMLTLLEPLMIGFLGVVVGGIVISLYMPLFSMISKLSG